ncbi:MAG: glycosyltransferase family 4 protein, partial [Gemmatimonadaceae bacterium]
GRRIDPPTPETLIALGVPPGAPLVVMVAALTAEKDPITFVRAVAEARRSVPALCALLVGDGPLRAEVERAAMEAGVSGALRLPGFRDDAESLLAGADVVALSSRLEGTSGVILDALSLGKPVVATAAGGNVEIIADRSSGLLVPVGDARAMGARVAEVLSDSSLARQLSRGARRRAEDYSIDRTVDRTLEVYRRVLAAG